MNVTKEKAAAAVAPCIITKIMLASNAQIRPRQPHCLQLWQWFASFWLFSCRQYQARRLRSRVSIVEILILLRQSCLLTTFCSEILCFGIQFSAKDVFCKSRWRGCIVFIVFLDASCPSELLNLVCSSFAWTGRSALWLYSTGSAFFLSASMSSGPTAHFPGNFKRKLSSLC